MAATKIVINGEEVEIGGSSAVPQGVSLLDNAHFIPIYDYESNMILPIDQRGITGVFSTAGSYFIDRWVLISGSVEITDSGLKLNGTIEQRFEYAFGDNLTATALSTTGFVAAEYDDEGKRFQITANGETIIAAKLELGDTQTLAHQNEDGNWVLNDPPPNFALELARCQRYQIIGNVAGFSHSQNPINGIRHIFITLPAKLRVTPTIIGDPIIVDNDTVSVIKGTTIGVGSWRENGLFITVSNLSGSHERISIDTNSWWGLDANL